MQPSSHYHSSKTIPDLTGQNNDQKNNLSDLQQNKAVRQSPPLTFQQRPEIANLNMMFLQAEQNQPNLETNLSFQQQRQIMGSQPPMQMAIGQQFSDNSLITQNTPFIDQSNIIRSQHPHQSHGFYDQSHGHVGTPRYETMPTQNLFQDQTGFMQSQSMLSQPSQRQNQGNMIPHMMPLQQAGQRINSTNTGSSQQSFESHQQSYPANTFIQMPQGLPQNNQLSFVQNQIAIDNLNQTNVFQNQVFQGGLQHTQVLMHANKEQISQEQNIEPLDPPVFSSPQPNRKLSGLELDQDDQIQIPQFNLDQKFINTPGEKRQQQKDAQNNSQLSALLKTTDQNSNSMSITDNISVRSVSSPSDEQRRQAALKILPFLKLNLKIRTAFKQKLLQVATQNVTKIQKFLKSKNASEMRRKGWYNATLYLEGYQSAQSVEIFGEFTSKTSGPWSHKIPCQRVRAKTFGFANSGWKAQVLIKTNQKFKFVIDQGQAFVVSPDYMIDKDQQGNENNVFRFHSRNDRQEQQVRQSYPIIKIPELPKEDNDYKQQLYSKLLLKFDIDEEVQFQEYSTAHSALYGNSMKLNVQVPSLQSPQPILSQSFGQKVASMQDPYYLLQHENALELPLSSSSDNFKKSFKDFSTRSMTLKLEAKTKTSSLAETMQSIKNQLSGEYADLASQQTGETGLTEPSSPGLSLSRKKSLRSNSTDFTNNNFDTYQNQLNCESLKESSGATANETSPNDKSNSKPKGSLTLISAGYKIGKPHVDNVCEDAFFVCDRAFGVADGVSGWNDFGFSSHAFSNNLMEFCQQEIESFDQKNPSEKRAVKEEFKQMRKSRSFLNFDNFLDPSPALPVAESTSENPLSQSQKSLGEDSTKKPADLGVKTKPVDRGFLHSKQILKKAFDQVKAVGSSTAVVAIQNGEKLNIANLGDSGFQLYRQSKTVTYLDKYSKEQTHNFNVPYQLSVLPSNEEVEELRLRGKIKECMQLREILRKGRENLCQDMPEHADEYTLELKEGDVIITGSDGVFDNLFNHEILSMVQNNRDLKSQELAKLIVDTAQAKVTAPEGPVRNKVQTPYQRKYKKEYNATWVGGKEDDITCVVTRVVLQ